MFEDQNSQVQPEPAQMAGQGQPPSRALVSEAGPAKRLPTVEDLAKQKISSALASKAPGPVPNPASSIPGAPPLPNSSSSFGSNQIPKSPQVEDIFEGTESHPGFGSSAGKRGRESLPPGPKAALAGSALGPKKLPAFKKMIIITISLLFALALMGVGFLVYNKFIRASILEKEAPKAQRPGKTEKEPKASQEIESIPTEPEAGTEPQPDADSDGLTDAEEAALATNPLSSDTDGDQLSDLDEVEIYKTDPLNPDTDGDTYLDGVEVINGYDPNGLGKLLQAPLSRESTSAAAFKEEGRAVYLDYLKAVEASDFETVKRYLPQETLDQLADMPIETVGQTFELLKAWSVKPENLEIASVRAEGEKVIIEARDKSQPEKNDSGATNKGVITLYKAGEQWKVGQESWEEAE